MSVTVRRCHLDLSTPSLSDRPSRIRSRIVGKCPFKRERSVSRIWYYSFTGLVDNGPSGPNPVPYLTANYFYVRCQSSSNFRHPSRKITLPFGSTIDRVVGGSTGHFLCHDGTRVGGISSESGRTRRGTSRSSRGSCRSASGEDTVRRGR